MKKSNLDLATIQQLHKSGQLDAAKSGYLKFLQQHPAEAEALHALGILCAQQGEYSDAVEYLQKAADLDADNPPLHLNLGNALKALGLYGQAADALLRAIQLDPGYSAALNNLGTVYYAQGKLADAVQYYRLAIAQQPQYADAYYNLGLALSKQEKLAEAITTYEALIAFAPDNAAAYFQLGCVLMQQDKLETAIQYFLSVEANFPNHFETQTNLATAYLKKGLLKEAKTHYLKALALAPNDTQVLFNLGVVNMQQGNTDSAIQYYQRALKINADFFAAHNNLGVAFLAKQHVGYALQHFRAALQLQPDNEAIKYTVQMLAQDERLHASPPEYIRNLFDTYADHYEQHLLVGLDYHIPELLLQAVTSILKKAQHRLDILDLGCGTGLCGVPFKPLAKSLTGVDLSPKMLELATQKNIYDTVVTADLLTFLKETTASYDLILAGDVFVYIGELKALFAAVSNALRAEGLFAFNTEITEKENYTMNQSGRFSHQKKYLEALAQQNGLTVVYYQTAVTRQQNNEPVPGHVYVLKKRG